MGQSYFYGTNRSSRLVGLLWCGAAALVLALSSTRAAAQAAPAAGAVQDPSKELYDLGFKFQGSSSCSNAKCHGGPNRNLGATYVDNSYTMWNKEDTPDAPADQHRTSFKKLRLPLAAQITTKMKLGAPTQEVKCLACHTVNPPAALLDAGPITSEGVTCNGCHGPSGPKAAGGGKGWVDLHTVRGWHVQQRQRPHDQVLKQFGFYDTKPLIERAERCVSCHLAIDPAMVSAGHPQPMFELNWFSITYNNRHWDDPTDKYFGGQLWAAGQIVALRDALQQLAQRATADAAGSDQVNVSAAYNQAFAHYATVRHLAPVAKVDMAGLTAGLGAANKALNGAANRAALAKAADDAAKAVTAQFPAVKAWTPDQASVMTILKGVASDPNLVALGAFGIEQQRDAIFALYNAYAGSAEGQKDPAAQNNLKEIGDKLFPSDNTGPIPAAKVPVAQYQAGLNDVKGKLKL